MMLGEFLNEIESIDNYKLVKGAAVKQELP